MIEKEIRGEIDLKTFSNKIVQFTDLLGEPTHYRRLSLLVFDVESDIDTRIRITNGKSEIMQKIRLSTIDSVSEKREIAIPIESDAESIYNLYQVFLHLITDAKRPITITAETENFIWKYKSCEIKLSHLYGKSDYYNFEIEALNEDSDLKRVQAELELVDMFGFSSPGSRKRRRDLAYDLTKISKELFLEIIRKYI